MDFEKYTDRAKGFIQSAQSLALREGHQQFAPEHLLKVLLDDPEGLAAGLIDRSGGRSREALTAVEAALAKIPKVSGSGAGQVYLAPALARLFDQAQKIAEKAGDSYVTVERLLLALSAGQGERGREDSRPRRGDPAESQRRDRGAPQRAARPTLPRPRTLMMPSRNTRATLPRPRATARSILSLAATRRSGAPSRCSRGGPRTTRC